MAEVLVEADGSEVASGVPEILARMGVRIRVGRLPAGDYLIGERVLVERKAAGDFARSLYDGRLFRQLTYMRRSVADTLLIVEGRAVHVDRLWPRALRPAMVSAALDFRVPLLHTSSPEASARLIADIGLRQLKDSMAGGIRPVHRSPLQAALARELPAVRMLAAVPGIGPALARALLARFAGIAALARARLERLEQVRGIGPARARRLYEALHSGLVGATRRGTAQGEASPRPGTAA
ncbi:MAG: hypothetical protein HY554_15805 [Elusimicrobia bacterium]|nr:hypothetical protein [Elusimicrobiota bacterium]